MPHTPPHEGLTTGTVVGRYRVERLLGQGGMGAVFEAVQEGLGRRVALKILDATLAVDPTQLERFRREGEVVASLGHPNIVQVTDFQSSSEEGPYLVMELLRGQSLGDLLDREKVLGPNRLAFVVAQVLSALGAAHRAGVVHRDIKPDNIFILGDAAVPDTVKVLDFGIAKLAADGQNAKLTNTNAMLGTPSFMAPEQARGVADVDARADIYAVGATMYQALTGRLPHEAGSIPALLFAIVEQKPMPLRELRPDLPADYIELVDRAMAKDRDARFQNADEMRAALAPFSGLPVSSSSPSARDEISATAATLAGVSAIPVSGSQQATPMTHTRTPAPPAGLAAVATVPSAELAPAPAPAPASVAEAATGASTTTGASTSTGASASTAAPAAPGKRGVGTLGVVMLGLVAITALVMAGVVGLASVNNKREERLAHSQEGANEAAAGVVATALGSQSAPPPDSVGAASSLATPRGVGAVAVAPKPGAASETAQSATAPPIASASSATATATATAGAGRHHYSGSKGSYSGADFGDCPSCDWEAFRTELGTHEAEVSACFKASEFEPPVHEYPYYVISVAANGTLQGMQTVAGSGTPKLDRCMHDVIFRIPMHKPSGSSGSFRLSFRSECVPGWAGQCK